MSKRRVATLIIESLEAAGAKNCYGIVGDSINHLAEAVYNSSLNWVHVRHEEVAAFAAGAEAHFTGGLSVCTGSCGPGSLHLVNGIFESNRNRSPVVFLASQISRDKIGLDFPQEMDFKPLFQQCSVFCKEVFDPALAQGITEQAARTALEKGGVAVVILPSDIMSAEVKARKPQEIRKQDPVFRPAEEDLQKIVALLAKGRKITIFAGAGVEGAHTELLQLAEKLKAPIAHTSRAKDFVEYDNPFNMGMTGLLGVKSGFYAVQNCDTLLMLGTDFAYPQFYGDKTTFIQIDHDPARLGRRHPVDLAVLGDIRASLRALLPLLPAREKTGFLKECLKKRKETVKNLTKEEKRTGKDIIHPQFLLGLLDKYADEDAIMTADVGSPMVWALRHFHINGKRRTLISLLHGTMANAMPQALGAQKAYPGRQVISLSGDGGLTMLMGDLLTTVQENLPIKIVVVNNGSLNFVELEQKVDGLVNRYTNLLNPDFSKMARSIGLGSWRAENARELEDTLPQFLAHQGPALLDVKTTPYELVMPPEITAENVANTALYSLKALSEGRFRDITSLIRDNFLQ